MKQPQQSENHPVAVLDVPLLPMSPRPIKAALVPVDGCGSQAQTVQLPLPWLVVLQEQRQEVAVLEEPGVVRLEEEVVVVVVKLEEGVELEVVKLEVAEGGQVEEPEVVVVVVVKLEEGEEVVKVGLVAEVAGGLELEVVKVEGAEGGEVEVVLAAAAAHFKSSSSLCQLRPLSSWSSPPIP
jgi:hypothetical protein